MLACCAHAGVLCSCWRAVLMLACCAHAAAPAVLQRDPGEALLELQQLGAVQPEELRQARIDLHLRRCAALAWPLPSGCHAAT